MNLQLFAYDPYSIVDHLKSQGQDSSMEARAKIAENLGIQNYTGTGSQNSKMLKMLKNGAGSQSIVQPVTSKNGNATNKNVTASAITNVNGVDDATMNKLNSTYTASDGVKNAQGLAENAKNNLNSFSAPTVSADTWNAINTPFQASSAYQDAMNYTNSMLQKLSSGRTSYTDQIKDMMNKIQNREKFSYDVESDMMFQQALASAMGSGKQAMQDTIGQASSLTGGYGSTYATSAGNQAYNAYIEDAYNNLPEYYQMAMDAYNMEGQEMYNQLDMLSMADAQEYQRMFDSYNLNSANAQNMYAKEYGAWQDSVNNAYNSANMQLQQHEQAYNQAYNTYGALQDNANTLYAQEYQSWQDKINNAMNVAGMQNSDYWKQASMDQENSQFTAMNDLNGDGKVDSKDIQMEMSYKASSSGSSSGGGGTGEDAVDLKEPSETQMKKALEAFNTGGEEELYKYVDSLPSNIDVDKIDMYVTGDGADVKGYGELPLEKRTFTKTKDTFNWLWGNDNNDIVEDQYGNSYRIDALPEELRKPLTKLKNGQSYSTK